MSSSDEQFEAWFEGMQCTAERCGHRLGDHERGLMEAAWDASRAAVVVQLPETEYFGDSWSGGWAITKDDVTDALEEQGLKVTP